MVRPDAPPAPGRVQIVVSFAVVVVVMTAVIVLGRAPTPATPGTAATAGAVGRPDDRSQEPPAPRPPLRTAPVARLSAPVLRVPPGDRPGSPVRVLLDAGLSSDADGDRLRYRWDLDGDGRYDGGDRSTVRLRLVDRDPVRVTVLVADGTGFADRASVVVRPPDGRGSPGRSQGRAQERSEERAQR